MWKRILVSSCISISLLSSNTIGYSAELNIVQGSNKYKIVNPEKTSYSTD